MFLGRGAALRTKIKEEILASQSVAVAMEEAHRKIEARKSLKQSVEEHLGKFIDRLTGDDLIKIGTIIGLAYILKPTLEVSEELRNKMDHIDELINKYSAYATKQEAGQPAPFSAAWQGIKLAAPWVPMLVSSIIPSEYAKPDEARLWILSLVVASVIILIGPSILSAIGGVSKLAGFLLT